MEMTPRQTNIVRYGTFEYILDDRASLEGTGAVPDPNVEARLIAALGRF